MTTPPVHVVVAVIMNDQGEVLLAQRPPDTHQGGLWEFPGGKVEPREDMPTALNRELWEELGITVSRFHPLLRTRHDYPDKSVLLDVWRVSALQGEPRGREGQPVRWVPVQQLREYALPSANAPIVSALLLPALYLITGECGEDQTEFLARLEQAASGGARLIQLRAKSLDPLRYRQLAEQALVICRRHGTQLLFNADPGLAIELDADGVHLDSMRLMQLQSRPLFKEKWVGASCHTADEVRHACRIGVDFIMVSPVLPTRSHPETKGMGWETLHELTELATLPVYALGGMSADLLARACQQGVQGVAVVSAIWDAENIAAAVREYLK